MVLHGIVTIRQLSVNSFFFANSLIQKAITAGQLNLVGNGFVAQFYHVCRKTISNPQNLLVLNKLIG
jgi:hypothetical protein